MSKFDFIQRVLLQRPSTANVKQVFNQIQASLGSVNTRVNLTTDPASIRSAVNQVNNLNNSLKKTKNLSDDFANILANATRRFAGISIATGTMLALVRGIKNAYKESLEFERQMKRVEIASGATQSQIKQLSDEVLRLGAAYGVSSLEMASNARIFAQAGFSAKTTAKALDILAKTNVAGTFGDMADTTEGIVAVLQQFRKEVVLAGGETQFLEKTFDSIQNVSKKFAVEAEDIVVGIRKAGAAFESAGGNIDELIGVMTSLRSATRESASTLANSVKTIFTRIQRPETVEFLQEMGVELVDMEGKFVGPIEAIERLASALAVLDKGDIRYAQIADKIGGIYQINRLLTLLKNTSMTTQAIDLSNTSEGVLAEDAQKGLETTISKIERLNQSFFSLVKLFSESASVKRIVDLLINMADAAITVTKSLEPMLPLLTSVLLMGAGRFGFKVAQKMISFGKTPQAFTGTQVGGYASGGRVWGGKPGTDTVPAMLDNGEFVVNRKDAAKHLGLLTAINNGSLKGYAKGGSVGNPGINTLDPFTMETKNVDLSTASKDLKIFIQEISRFSLTAKKVLEDAIKNIKNIPDGFGSYAPALKTVGVQTSKYNPYTLKHEVGHAVDSAGSGITQSRTSGSFNNELAKLATPLALKNSQSSKFSDSMVNYRTQPQEVYAELFANVDDKTKAFMAEMSATTLGVKDLKDSFHKLLNAINTGKANFGPEIEGNIRSKAKDLGIKPVLGDPDYTPPNVQLLDKSKTKIKDARKSVINDLLNTEDDRSAGLGGTKISKRTLKINKKKEEPAPTQQTVKDPFSAFKKSSSPQNPDQPTSSNGQAQEVERTTSMFNQKLLLSAGALALLASQTGMLSGDFEKASASAAAMFASVKLVGSFIEDFLPSKGDAKSIASDAADMIDVPDGGGKKGGKLGKAGKAGRFGRIGGLVRGGAGRVGALAGGFGGAVSGIGAGLAIAQGTSSFFASKAETSNSQKDDILKRITEKGAQGGDLDKILELSGATRSNTEKSERSMGLGTGGTLTGATTGAIIGSFVPVIGTAVGAAVGGVLGGIVGSVAGAQGDEKAYVKVENSATLLAKAQFDAAKGVYEFDKALGDAKANGLSGDSLTKITSEQIQKAQSTLLTNQSRESKAQAELGSSFKTQAFQTLGGIGFGDYTLSDLGIGLGAGQLTSGDQKSMDAFKAANDSVTENLVRASQEDISARKDGILSAINAAESLDDLYNTTSNFGPQLENIRSSAYTSVVGSAEDKKKASEAEVKATRDMIDKVSKARANEILRIESASRVRQLELDAIQRSTSSMLALASMDDQMQSASDALERFTTGFSKGVSGDTFSDLTMVADQGVFAKKARDVGSQFAGGQVAASNVISGAQFVDQFRSGISGQMADSFKSITGQKLDAGQTNSAVMRELSQLSSFRNMDSKQQKAIASIVQEELAQGKFSPDQLDKALGRVTDIFKRDADTLSKWADKLNQSIEKIRAYNETLIQSQAQLTELRAGQVDIIATGNNRITEALSRYGNIGTEFQALNQKDSLRTERSNVALQGAGIAPIAGDLNALSGVLASLESRKNQIEQMQKSTNDAVQIAKLNTENQKLAIQTKAVTEELGKLANQSDKAADIMTKLEKVRQLKDYTGSRVKEFVSGGQQERSRMMREVYGLQQVMMSRNFNVLSDDIRGSVMKMMEERARLDPTGRMQKIYDMSLNNAALQLGLSKNDIQQAFGRPNNAENQLINTLYDLNRKEFQAQQVLIDHQIRNTNATLMLINQISMVNGQRINPALMQPQMLNNNPAQNFNMNQGMMNQNMNNNFNNMQMQHQMNVNGQLNVNGLNSDKIADAIVQEVTGYVVRQVNVQMNRGRRGFRAGN
jgi:uncharacterized membrane protein